MRVSAAMAEKVSFDTSGKDPEAVKARLMIGNLNTANCTRQEVIELCRPFGTVKGLSMFRGYCFVQFANEQEAQLATSGLKNYNFHGSKLDTRPATVGRATVMNSNVSAPIKRPRYDFLFGGQRIRVETAVSRNRAFAQEVFEALKDVNFHDHGKEDTLICGSCRSVYPTMRAYVEHRRMKKCPFFEREVAPSSISCFTCREEFHEPWEFVQHLIHRHSINLYRGTARVGSRLFTFLYLVLGAFVFGLLEHDEDLKLREELNKTLITTVGYGHSTPLTASGKIFYIFYALLGIPLGLVCFQSIGERINTAVKSGLIKFQRLLVHLGVRGFKEVKTRHLLFVSSSIGTLTILVGTIVFHKNEQWSLLDSFFTYHRPRSASGIGCPPKRTTESRKIRHNLIMFTLFFILFGLAVFSACINLLILEFMATNNESRTGKGRLRRLLSFRKSGSFKSPPSKRAEIVPLQTRNGEVKR
ncbi:hypothetical protein M3Y99_00079200 [Aphelenchoides fujianensis]|nr:hypothetical protein M3Y99_00079200 [Aphelenchoides fujianensis]